MSVRKFLLIVFLFVFPKVLFAQGVEYSNFAWALGSGNVPLILPGATVTVCAGTTLPALGITCSPKTLLIYTDATLGTQAGNPITADAGGNYSFWAVPMSSFVISVSYSGYTTYSYSWTAPLLPSTSMSFTGNNNHSGTETFKYLNNVRFASQFASLQAAINDIAVGTKGEVWVDTALPTITTQVTVNNRFVTLKILAGGQLVFNTGANAGIYAYGNDATTHFRIECASAINPTISSAGYDISAVTMTGPLIQFGPTGGQDSNTFGGSVKGCRLDGGSTSAETISQNGWYKLDISGNYVTNFTTYAVLANHGYNDHIHDNNFNQMVAGCTSVLGLNDSSNTVFEYNAVFPLNCNGLTFLTAPSNGVLSMANDYEQLKQAWVIPTMSPQILNFTSYKDFIENTTAGFSPIDIGTGGSTQPQNTIVRDLQVSSNAQAITITAGSDVNFENCRFAVNITFSASMTSVILLNNAYGGSKTNNIPAAQLIDLDTTAQMTIGGGVLNGCGAGCLLVPTGTTLVTEDTGGMQIRQSGDSQPRTALKNGFVQFGPGGASVVDTTWQRSAVNCLGMGNTLLCGTAPTITGHFNTSSDSISANNGTAAFTVTVGTGAAGSTGTVGLPTATTGWICFATNRNRGAYIQQTASTVASATFTNYGTTIGTPVNWTNSDVLGISCYAY